VPVLTFLFAWFCQADEARVFMLERGEESQTADFGEQLLLEAKSMFSDCVNKLAGANCLHRYLQRD
jgi:hypothetical protein